MNTHRLYFSATIEKQTKYGQTRSPAWMDVVRTGDPPGTEDWTWFGYGHDLNVSVILTSPARHLDLAVHIGVRAVSPEFGSWTELRSWVNNRTVGSLPDGVRLFAHDRGVSLRGIDMTTSLNAAMRHIYRQSQIAKDAKKHGGVFAREFLKLPRNMAWSSTPVEMRAAVSDWFVVRKIDFSWITGATTVDEIIEYVRDRAVMNHPPLVPSGVS